MDSDDIVSNICLMCDDVDTLITLREVCRKYKEISNNVVDGLCKINRFPPFKNFYDFVLCYSRIYYTRYSHLVYDKDELEVFKIKNGVIPNELNSKVFKAAITTNNLDLVKKCMEGDNVNCPYSIKDLGKSSNEIIDYLDQCVGFKRDIKNLSYVLMTRNIHLIKKLWNNKYDKNLILHYGFVSTNMYIAREVDRFNEEFNPDFTIDMEWLIKNLKENSYNRYILSHIMREGDMDTCEMILPYINNDKYLYHIAVKYGRFKWLIEKCPRFEVKKYKVARRYVDFGHDINVEELKYLHGLSSYNIFDSDNIDEMLKKNKIDCAYYIAQCSTMKRFKFKYNYSNESDTDEDLRSPEENVHKNDSNDESNENYESDDGDGNNDDSDEVDEYSDSSDYYKAHFDEFCDEFIPADIPYSKNNKKSEEGDISALLPRCSYSLGLYRLFLSLLPPNSYTPQNLIDDYLSSLNRSKNSDILRWILEKHIDEIDLTEVILKLFDKNSTIGILLNYDCKKNGIELPDRWLDKRDGPTVHNSEVNK